jgi:hypothetical protein
MSLRCSRMRHREDQCKSKRSIFQCIGVDLQFLPQDELLRMWPENENVIKIFICHYRIISFKMMTGIILPGFLGIVDGCCCFYPFISFYQFYLHLLWSWRLMKMEECLYPRVVFILAQNGIYPFCITSLIELCSSAARAYHEERNRDTGKHPLEKKWMIYLWLGLVCMPPHASIKAMAKALAVQCSEIPSLSCYGSFFRTTFLSVPSGRQTPIQSILSRRTRFAFKSSVYWKWARQVWGSLIHSALPIVHALTLIVSSYIDYVLKSLDICSLCS